MAARFLAPRVRWIKLKCKESELSRNKVSYFLPSSDSSLVTPSNKCQKCGYGLCSFCILRKESINPAEARLCKHPTIFHFGGRREKKTHAWVSFKLHSSPLSSEIERKDASRYTLLWVSLLEEECREFYLIRFNFFIQFSSLLKNLKPLKCEIQ